MNAQKPVGSTMYMSVNISEISTSGLRDIFALPVTLTACSPGHSGPKLAPSMKMKWHCFGIVKISILDLGC